MGECHTYVYQCDKCRMGIDGGIWVNNLMLCKACAVIVMNDAATEQSKKAN